MTLNENAKKWIAALRSGKYEQARSQLRGDKNAFCCLGVACELYRKETKGRWRSDEFSDWNFLGESDFLPTAVQRWLGLSDWRGTYLHSSLANKNDDGATFEEIAEIIESEPEGLFA